MCDSLDFHAQLAAIIDVLAKSAVAEISRLVDDGYSLLRLEVSQSQKQNEALKRRLRMMEQRFAQALIQIERAGVHENFLNNRTGVHISERSKKTTEDCSLTEEGKGERMNVTLCSDGELAAVHEEPSPGQPDVTSPVQLLEVAETEAKLTLIKQEKPEEDLRNGPVEWRAGSREKRPVEETQNKAANHTEELTEQHRTRRAVWEVSGLESALKTEPDYSGANKRDQHSGSENATGGLYHLDSEYFMFGRASHPGAVFISEGGETEAESSAGSYAPATDSENLSVELIDVTSALNGCTSSDAHLVTSQGLFAHCKDVARKKGYVCKYCGKTFSRRNVMVKHHRVHTGEKPFGCLLCGRRFSDSSNLKKHQSVHTGEKRFRCAQCGKRFSDSSSRKRHQTVHTGKKPFGCAECGKRFTRSCHLKRHCQQFHSWQMTFNEHAV